MFKNLPDWVQMLIAVGTLLFTIGVAYANLKGEVRVEATERKAADDLLDQKQQQYNRDIEDIKHLFQQEIDAHHPRKN